MEETTSVKFDIKVYRFAGLSGFYRSSTIGILRVSLNVHESMEVCISDIYGDFYTVGKTVDNDVWTWEVGLDQRWWWNGNCW
jgi:hypothetical protein